jgi:hypothetical protein
MKDIEPISLSSTCAASDFQSGRELGLVGSATGAGAARPLSAGLVPAIAEEFSNRHSDLSLYARFLICALPACAPYKLLFNTNSRIAWERERLPVSSRRHSSTSSK